MLGLLRKPKDVDTYALQQTIARANKAENLAKDEAFAEALTKVEAAYMQAWESAEPFDVELRERAWIAKKLLSDLRAQILATVCEGVTAQKQIEKSLRQ